MRILRLLLVLAVLTPSLLAAQAQRPMTFLDMQYLKRAGSWAPSPDGRWMLYTVTTPNWEEDRQQSDLYLVSLADGIASGRQLTFTDENDEDSPAWSRDGRWFAFLSDRDAPTGGNGGAGRNQLYLMRPDGGEARKLTDAKDGVRDFAFSPDGRWVSYRAGKELDAQLFRLPMDRVFEAEAEQLTETEAGVEQWKWSPDGGRIYFTTPDSRNRDEELRREKGFTVNIRNAETPLSSLWVIEAPTGAVSRLTHDESISVDGFTISPDSRWVGFRGISADRYERNITEEGINADLFLLEVASGQIERLTHNEEVPERGPDFSPDSRWIAFSAPDELTRYSMTNERLYLRETSARGATFQKLGSGFDGDLSIGFWSEDGKTIYFNEGWKATRQLFALDIAKDAVRQVTDEAAALAVSQDEDTGVLLINYQDPSTPPTLFTVARLDRIARRAEWTQLVDVNPQVRDLALGTEEEITWTSTDGREVGGVLVKPVGYQEGQRYPLIVAIHGGPASADVLGFNGGYGAQAYAGAGYAVLRPNYRGSTNYGQEHRTAIVGDYFPQGYDDIMTGVDHLIAQGIVDEDRMGVLGWSAGGHWSNWILTHTDRFKAISSGAGTMNWISMYAQSDVQRNRQFYLGDGLMYDDFEPYWEQSPIQYIRNAKTPTMVHVVEGDPRVPSPQSVELHMALKKLGVPTELFMYPGRSHGIPDARNRLVKSVSEMAWMDYYVRGQGNKFDWRQVLETLPGNGERPRAATEQGR
ncbi:MAG: S9 family peptidase [Gemmatimonadota bacterium]